MARQAAAAGPISYRAVPHTKLKIAIVKRGLSQRRLAGHVRISESRLSRILHGHLEPTTDEQDRLADVLGEPRGSLFRVIAL
jgi:transcriptional regulator with XRE-family HTH domain